MVTVDEVDTAFHYLNDTIDEYGQAHSYLCSLKITEKIILSQQLLDGFGKTLGEREAQARVSGEYKRWERQYTRATYDFDLIRAKRAQATLTWDRYQSELSARKAGVPL